MLIHYYSTLSVFCSQFLLLPGKCRQTLSPFCPISWLHYIEYDRGHYRNIFARSVCLAYCPRSCRSPSLMLLLTPLSPPHTRCRSMCYRHPCCCSHSITEPTAIPAIIEPNDVGHIWFVYIVWPSLCGNWQQQNSSKVYDIGHLNFGRAR